MKKIKQIVGLGLCLTILGSVLASCGGGDQKPSEKSSESNISSKEEKGSDEQVTVHFINWQTNHKEANQKIVDAYEKEHPNVKIEMEYIGDMSSQDYLKKVDIMLMGDEPIDIVMTPGYEDYATRADSGSYLSLEDYFTAEGKSIDELYDSQMAVNDKHYGIASDMKYNIVLINKDMLDAAGLPVPPLDWTWEDYQDYAVKLTQGEGPEKVYGSYFHNWATTMNLGIQTKIEGNQIFKNEKELLVGEPTYQKWFEYIYQLENIDNASTPLVDIKSLNMNYRDQFFTGKIAMLPIATYMIPEIGNAKYPHDFVTTFAPIPTWDGGTSGMVSGAPLIYSIAKTAQHPQEAYDYLRFLTTEGVRIKSMFISSEKDVNKMDFVEPMVENFKALVDMDALNNVMKNPAWKDNTADFIPTYQKEVQTMLYEEFEKYLLDAQNLETTIKNMESNAKQIISKY